MTLNLQTLTIAQAAELIKSRQLSPVELVEAHLARIEAEDGVLKSYITVTAELARIQAKRAETHIMAGNYKGPLHGIPLAHKDCVESAGIRTTNGSILLDDYIPAHNAHVLQKLENEWAIVLGKLNMHEWAMSITTNNPFYGRCVNPHDPSRIPGGSSGGSGAAVAAGLCMGSLGTDAGGSVRLPAALCGIVGFKPTFGSISRRGVIPLSYSMDHVGTMARTVYDAALLYDAIAGYDPEDPFTIHASPLTDFLEPYLNDSRYGLAKWRVAVAFNGFNRDGKQPDTEVVESLMAVARRMEAAGAIITEVELPRMDEAARANFLMIVTEAADLHAERLFQQPEGFSPEIYGSFERGRGTLGTDYAHARKTQVEVTHAMEQFFEEYELLITPTHPVPAPIHNEPPESQRARMSMVAYTAPFNLTGNPALSIPCGKTKEGLPIGIQLVGNREADARVILAGQYVERLLASEA
jgi:aspartyl-tRNA(Asn)/glutamyl-tRNA(Gln) amidotransferase subunit A